MNPIAIIKQAMDGSAKSTSERQCQATSNGRASYRTGHEPAKTPDLANIDAVFISVKTDGACDVIFGKGGTVVHVLKFLEAGHWLWDSTTDHPLRTGFDTLEGTKTGDKPNTVLTQVSVSFNPGTASKQSPNQESGTTPKRSYKRSITKEPKEETLSTPEPTEGSINDPVTENKE